MMTHYQLDIVVPTYNRADLLLKTLESFTQARIPPHLSVSILVVDNNSKDHTAQMIRDLSPDYPLPLKYLLELKQSSSHARNAGILASKADLIAFVDDDEEVEPDWLEVIEREFQDPSIKFVGGSYLANWVTPIPDWLPPGYHSIIGVIPPKTRARFDTSYRGTLMGGNCAFRRSVFDQVGLYSTQLGRSGKGLLAEEDADMQRRLVSKRISGLYVPDLSIRHYIAPERLTRSYHRRWVFWRGASQGVLDRSYRVEDLPYFLGVPRYRFGQAVRGLMQIPLLRLRKGKAEAFRAELTAWDLIGFIYGKYFLRLEQMYGSAEQSAASSAPAA